MGGKKVLINWLIRGAYFLCTSTPLKMMAEFILVSCHYLLLLTFALDASTTASFGGEEKVGVKINSTARIKACFI